MAVRLIIDSASDISEAESKELGVTMLPLLVTIEGEEYLDGVDLSAETFYDKLIESSELPKTSQITPFRFEEAFEKATANGDEVVAITISSKLSGTYAAACQAAGKFEGKVYVVDSLNACIGERLLCLYALKKVKEGLGAKALVSELDRVKKKINVMAMLNTLEYLKKGGRISSAVAFVGEMLSIKPVIAVVDGEIKLVGKALGSKKGNNLLNTLVKEKGGINFDMPYGIVWSGNSKALLEKYVKDSAALYEEHTSEIPAYIVGSTIGTHIGPGAVGVAFFEN